jgi:hypothetical protein
MEERKEGREEIYIYLANKILMIGRKTLSTQ